MLRNHARGLLIAIFYLAVAPITAGLTAQAGQGPRVLPAPPAMMQQFDVSIATLQSLHLPAQAGPAVAVDVVFGGRLVRFDVAPNEVRSSTFQLWENGANGMQLLPTPPSVTYRGDIAGDPGSAVAATIEGGSMRAYARAGNGDLWLVQPVTDVQPGAAPALHIVFRGRDSVQLPVQCGVQAAGVAVPSPFGEDVVYLADMAIEADFPFFQLNGSNVTSTQNDITGIVNAMNVIYERDVDIRLVVSQMIINSSPDAYTSSFANTLLNQFGNRWNTVHAGVPRDFAHLFTGRNVGAASGGTIGIATVGTVCSIGSAYGLSQNRFSSNYGRRVAVTAHEIGHNFGAGHCNTSPPCRIMCSGIGGCGGVLTGFGPASSNQIIAFRQSIGCLTQQASTPVITSASPTSIKTANPAQVTINGSGFLGTTHVTVGSTQVAGVNVISDNQLRFFPPTGLPLGVHLMTVTNAVGTSNNSGLIYTAALPAELVVTPAVLGGNTVTWTMGGWNGDFGILVISLNSTTSPWMGWPLVNGPVVLWQGGLDARGMATYSFPVPSMTLSGLTVYTQLLDIRPAPLTVRSTSVVKSTLIVL